MAKKPKLEATRRTPNGGVAPRCQRVKKDGAQCGNVAREGFNVCARHGAGFRSREEQGTAKPTGRPPIHGLYSKQARTDIQVLAEQVYATEGALENSDRELALLKGTLWFLANQSETFVGKVAEFEAAAESMSRVLENFVVVKPGKESEDDIGRGEMTPEDARTIGKDIATCYKLVTALESWVMNLTEVTTKTITAQKTRAETAGKLAETKALDTFVKFVSMNRTIVLELAPDDDFIDAYEARLERELFGPNRLELPARETIEVSS